MTNAITDPPGHGRPDADVEPVTMQRSADELRHGLETHLVPRAGGAPSCFEFAYDGVHYHATVESGEAPRVALRADLGALPFSIEIGEARRLACQIIGSTARLARGHLMLTSDQDLILHAQAEIPQPLTPESILATVTALVLDLKGYIALLARTLNLGHTPATT